MKSTARQQFAGFDDEFLRQFAHQQRGRANEHMRQAATYQRAADAAEKEINRRKARGDDGKQDRD